MFDPTVLPEIQADRDAMLAIMPLCAPPDQVLLANQVRVLEGHIEFINRFGG